MTSFVTSIMNEQNGLKNAKPKQHSKNCIFVTRLAKIKYIPIAVVSENKKNNIKNCLFKSFIFSPEKGKGDYSPIP